MNKWFCNANRPETNVSDDLNSKSLSLSLATGSKNGKLIERSRTEISRIPRAG